MNCRLYRYRFAENVDVEDAEGTLQLAILAAQGILGEARVRMDCTYSIDPSIRAIIVDASTPVGQVISSIFTSFAMLEFGRDAVNVRPVVAITCREARA